MREHQQYLPLVVGAKNDGWKLFRIEDGNYNKKVADIIGICPRGKGVLVEVKSLEHGRPQSRAGIPDWGAYSTHQINWARVYAEADAFALLAEYDVPRREMRIWIPSSPEQFESKVYTPPFVILEKDNEGSWRGWNQILSLKPNAIIDHQQPRFGLLPPNEKDER